MDYFILFAVVIGIILLSLLAIKWAIGDMKGLSEKEIMGLKPGNMIRVRKDKEHVIYGRIAFLDRKNKDGVLKDKIYPHSSHYFIFSEIEEIL